MALIDGVNHVAILTDNLDRFVDFYTQVLELDVVFAEGTPSFRHAILRTGPNSWLHPAEVSGNSHGAATPRMFDRGHLDHLALTSASADTSRSCASGWCPGRPATALWRTSVGSAPCGSKTPTGCRS